MTWALQSRAFFRREFSLRRPFLPPNRRLDMPTRLGGSFLHRASGIHHHQEGQGPQHWPPSQADECDGVELEKVFEKHEGESFQSLTM